MKGGARKGASLALERLLLLVSSGPFVCDYRGPCDAAIGRRRGVFGQSELCEVVMMGNRWRVQLSGPCRHAALNRGVGSGC